jgi:hypothetical protein
MTDETEYKIKKALFARMREKAVACLHAMGACAGDHEPDSWEGVMTMLEDVLAHSHDATKQSAAILASEKWMHAYLECETMKEVAETAEMIAHEMAEAKDAGSAAGDPAKTVRTAMPAQAARPPAEAK